MMKKTIAFLLLLIGVWLLVWLTGPIRETIRGAMSDWVLGHYEGLSRAEAPKAYFTAFWESGGWGWIVFLGLFGLPGIIMISIGVAILIATRTKSTSNHAVQPTR